MSAADDSAAPKLMPPDHEPIVVGLLWHSLSSDNLGVGALTLGQIALVQQAAARSGRSVRFLVVGTRGNFSYADAAAAVIDQAEFAFRAFKAGDFSAIALLRRCDLVLDIGEGDSFADLYGCKRLTVQVLAKWVARLSGAALILSPQTIGPFRTRVGRWLGRIGLAAARRVYVRDGLSRSCCEALRPGSVVREVIDVAFALPFTRPPRASDPRARIGINVSGLLLNGGYDGRNQFGLTLDYAVLVERLCEYFTAQEGVETYLVPHVISSAYAVEDDWRASEALRERFPSLHLAPRFRSPSEAKSFISGLDFFTGARMHACIAAFSAGVPVVPVAYSRKFAGLFGALGYEYMVDAQSHTLELALRKVVDGFADRVSLRRAVAQGNAAAQRLLQRYVDDLADLLPAHARLHRTRLGATP